MRQRRRRRRQEQQQKKQPQQQKQKVKSIRCSVCRPQVQEEDLGLGHSEEATGKHKHRMPHAEAHNLHELS